MTSPSLFDALPAEFKPPEKRITARCRDCDTREHFTTLADANRYHDGHRVAIML